MHSSIATGIFKKIKGKPMAIQDDFLFLDWD